MAELERLDEHRARIEDWLHACFQDCAPRGNLYDAMRYSLLAVSYTHLTLPTT